VEVDAAQLESALLNAAINARDAMPNGGTLSIATSIEPNDPEDFVRIDVRDTGLGMPQRVLERAFDPFFTTKEVGEGTGLGLSQIHGFAAQARGRAQLSSEEGAGTTVSLLLPRSDKELAGPQESGLPQSLQEGTRVLLVEDNPQVRAFANDLLQDLGCEVLCAASGDEALACLNDADVDVVLSDIVMPGMSGIELASRVKQARPLLPVVLATGYIEQAAQTSQPLTIILKPYSGTDLSTALAKAIATRRGLQRAPTR
jgi:CheY-like chemotaxis protein